MVGISGTLSYAVFVYLCICVVVCVTGHPGEGVHPGGVSGVLNPPATTAGPSPSLSTQLVLTTATLARKKCQKLRLKSSKGVLTVSLSTQLVPTTATLSKTGRPCWLCFMLYQPGPGSLLPTAPLCGALFFAIQASLLAEFNTFPMIDNLRRCTCALF